MQIIYLDQNHWIHLARAWKTPDKHEAIANIGAKLSTAVEAGRICLPLTAANIYETYKIYDATRREDLAIVQSSLSGGKVFSGRRERLTAEVSALIADICGLSLEKKETRWFLSSVFFEAFVGYNDERFPFPVSEKVLSAIRSDPQFFLFNYWMSAPDEERHFAVQKWSEGSEELRQRLERRRANLKNETVSLRRRAYSAALLIDEIEVILRIARSLDAPWTSVTDIGAANTRRLIRETPIYHVEREIVLRLEAQDRSLDENDFRDMASFCAVIPYADCIVAEKQFVNLARQAGLGKHYNTMLETNLAALNDIL